MQRRSAERAQARADGFNLHGKGSALFSRAWLY
jgi:hypothetical protein